jgi:hypothetical protein
MITAAAGQPVEQAQRFPIGATGPRCQPGVRSFSIGMYTMRHLPCYPWCMSAQDIIQSRSFPQNPLESKILEWRGGVADVPGR